MRTRNRLVAAVATLFWPGVAHLYVAETKVATALALGTLVGLIFAIAGAVAQNQGLTAAGFLGVLLVAIVDQVGAQRLISKLRR